VSDGAASYIPPWRHPREIGTVAHFFIVFPFILPEKPQKFNGIDFS
jgi:hypothetical protein